MGMVVPKMPARVKQATNPLCEVPAKSPEKESESDPLVSGIVAGFTDNCVLGALAGGDIGAAIIGDLLADGELF